MFYFLNPATHYSCHTLSPSPSAVNDIAVLSLKPFLVSLIHILLPETSTQLMSTACWFQAYLLSDLLLLKKTWKSIGRHTNPHMVVGFPRLGVARERI